MMRILQTLRRRMNGEGGFTIVEAMISITILAVGAFAVAQAMIFGLSTTGLSRQKLSSARRSTSRWKRPARSTTTTSSCLTPPPSPTRRHDEPRLLGGRRMPRPTTPTAAAPWRRSRSCGSPARRRRSQHYQNPLLDGATTYEVYRYVTWVDSPQDGTGEADRHRRQQGRHQRGPARREAGHRGRRLERRARPRQHLAQPSRRCSPTARSRTRLRPRTPRPAVGCPTASVADKTVTFTANASDSRRNDRERGVELRRQRDGNRRVGHAHIRRYATYTVVNTVTDNGGVDREQQRRRLHGDDGQPGRRQRRARTAPCRSTAARHTRTRRPSRCRSPRAVADRTPRR